MSGVGWQSTDLLNLFNQQAGRPTDADAWTPAQKYDFLGRAQSTVVDRIAAIDGTVLFSPPAAMTTADGGLTWTFGTDGNGYPLFPIGQAGIYSTLSAIPGGAWRPGLDYLDEGPTIRMPNNTPYAGPLYWYGVTPNQLLSASVQPILNPPPLRMLIVRHAVAEFAEATRDTDLANRQHALFEKDFTDAMLLLRKHYKKGGALGRLLYPWGVGAYQPGWGGQYWS